MQPHNTKPFKNMMYPICKTRKQTRLYVEEICIFGNITKTKDGTHLGYVHHKA